jgi:ribonuclease P protein component
MMRRDWRLTSREDFRHLREQGQTVRHAWVNLSWTANEQGHNRYGFITTKQLGGAVARNRVRRRLRAIMSQRHAALHQGFDVLLIARAAVVGQPFAALEQTIVDLTRRAGLERDSTP